MIFPEYHAFETTANPPEEDTMSRDEQMSPIEGKAPAGAEQQPRRLVSRRALVRAGWTVPVVLALNMLPVKAFASPGTCLVHTDIPAAAHVDVIVGTIHTDTAAQAHTDTCV